MRQLGRLAIVPILSSFLLIGAVGCGGGSGDLKEGTPDNIDFNKQYTPAAELTGPMGKDASEKAGGQPGAPGNMTP